MIRTTAMVLVTILALGTVVAAEAGINDRQRAQRMRIAQGARSGQLTANEVRKLGRQQVRIRRHEAKARSDGEFTGKERLRIHRELNRASRHIYREKHDNQTRN